MSRIKSRSGSGFTLIELLLASALLLAAAATIAVFMSQGIRIFSRLSAASQEEEAAICVTKMSHDLRNMALYSLIPFKGAEDRVSFASLENLSNVEGEPDPMPVQVSYRYDAEGARILREVIRPQTFERAESVRTETVLSGVAALKFEYEGDPSDIPHRVSFRIDYRGRFGSRSLALDVLIPAAPVHSETL